MTRFVATRLAAVALLLANAFALCDEPESSPFDIRLDRTVTSRWEFGVEIEATGDILKGYATAPVPFDWPEQKVTEVSRDVSAHVKKLTFRTFDGGAKQMLIQIPTLKAGETARAVITYDIEKRWIQSPLKTEELVKPDKPRKELAKYLGVSPLIETNDPTIRDQALAVGENAANDWDRARSLFDWIRANVEYKFAAENLPAVTALANKKGDCGELTSLVVAFCRVHKIPARVVWIPGHCYPEFYLVDPEGKGHWYPCQAAGGSDDFGRMPEDRPILQKGDSFKIPEDKVAHRWVAPIFSAKNVAGDPVIRFIQQRVDKKETPPEGTPKTRPR